MYVEKIIAPPTFCAVIYGATRRPYQLQLHTTQFPRQTHFLNLYILIYVQYKGTQNQVLHVAYVIFIQC